MRRWIFCCLVLLACTGEDERTPREPDAPSQGVEDLATLAALGYTDFAEADAQEGARTVLYDEAASWPGYDLYTSIPHGLAELVDAHGAVVHAWSAGEAVDWIRVRLLADGDLLIVGKASEAPPGRARFLERRAWDGTPRWRRDLPVHHDAIELADGRILTLTDAERLIPAIHRSRPCRDEFITYVSADGEVEERFSLFDLYAAASELPPLRTAQRQGVDPSLPLDIFHSNSVRLLGTCERTGASPLYAPGNALVSLRHQDAIAIVDLSAGRFLWMWGRGELVTQHEATLLPSGNVLLLDNGNKDRGYTRLVEVDPTTDQIVWEYRAADPASFFTASRGTAQALPNGNVIVGSTNQGEAFEVTRDKRVVWRFLNPHTDADGRRGALRIERLDAAMVDALLSGLDR